MYTRKTSATKQSKSAGILPTDITRAIAILFTILTKTQTPIWVKALISAVIGYFAIPERYFPMQLLLPRKYVQDIGDTLILIGKISEYIMKQP
jgi:hypothetical protein